MSNSECDSTSHETLSTTSDDLSGSRKRPRDTLSYDNLSPEDKLKLQKQFKLTRPRIVKKDFRREFPMLWVNVTNTGSYDFMMEHINTFYLQDVVLRQRDLRSCKSFLFLRSTAQSPITHSASYTYFCPL